MVLEAIVKDRAKIALAWRDQIDKYIERSDISFADRATAAEAMVKWYMYEGADDFALEWSTLASSQWRKAALASSQRLKDTEHSATTEISYELIQLLDSWADDYANRIVQAVSSEMLAEYYEGKATDSNSVEAYKQATKYWQRASDAWRELHLEAVDDMKQE